MNGVSGNSEAGLEILIKSSQADGIHVVLSGVRENVRETLVHAGIDRLIGADHICDHISKAVVMANSLADSGKRQEARGKRQEVKG